MSKKILVFWFVLLAIGFLVYNFLRPWNYVIGLPPLPTFYILRTFINFIFTFSAGFIVWLLFKIYGLLVKRKNIAPRLLIICLTITTFSLIFCYANFFIFRFYPFIRESTVWSGLYYHWKQTWGDGAKAEMLSASYDHATTMVKLLF